MPLLLNTARSGAAVELRGTNCMTIGLVNNMPDAACEATERQFLDLIRAATSNAVVHLKLFSIADVPRADPVRRELAKRYRDVAELWDTRLDGLIVTGTEPRAAKLEDEPYWATLTKLADWARHNTVSAIWSCLAAHAAVLHADGIARRPLNEKKFGVFDCDVVVPHPLMTGMKPRLRVLHSRYNDLPEGALAPGGYPPSYPISRGWRGRLRQGGAGRFFIRLFSGSSGIRDRYAPARIPPRRRPLPPRRAGALPGTAGWPFQRGCDRAGE